ncbi:hypothetical protein [Bacillus cereus group sp. BceL008]|uniref:hypothetical protein n=1 Tax=Bacillus cereus group sp. BceL008 TaxID=3445220 RepID=UPI003F26890B
MEEFKQNFGMKLGRGRRVYVHTSEHECKFSVEKVDTKENIVEWTSGKNTVLKVGLGIGTTVTIAANWISNFF